ncbi:uncharacterized protein N7511_009683 [Penicillium nucicola]|uniref:uncharacterized protein n=1 Tax=Penicillium nucicola TaxID=1850975 RepID=UPI0025457AAF|nr:uncharacterized protein N7511_009683 [Penicillium nucicola]KAJ5747987.1 hypothetical protein N7511_009683 [Penicillium nucicola]
MMIGNVWTLIGRDGWSHVVMDGLSGAAGWLLVQDIKCLPLEWPETEWPDGGWVQARVDDYFCLSSDLMRRIWMTQAGFGAGVGFGFGFVTRTRTRTLVLLPGLCKQGNYDLGASGALTTTS